MVDAINRKVLRSLNLSGNLVDEKSATAWSIALGESLMGLTTESLVQFVGWLMGCGKDQHALIITRINR